MKKVCEASGIALWFDPSDERFSVTRDGEIEVETKIPREAVIGWAEKAESALLRRLDAWKK